MRESVRVCVTRGNLPAELRLKFTEMDGPLPTGLITTIVYCNGDAATFFLYVKVSSVRMDSESPEVSAIINSSVNKEAAVVAQEERQQPVDYVRANFTRHSTHRSTQSVHDVSTTSTAGKYRMLIKHLLWYNQEFSMLT